MVERVLDNTVTGRGPVFTGPGRYVAPMLLFVSLVGALVFALFNSTSVVMEAFYANIYINGAIVGVLVIGMLYTFHQTLGVRPAVSWLRELSAHSNVHAMRPPPPLIAPMALITGDAGGRPRVSPQSARSILDSVGARMGEAGELTRYFTRLLIFLGLLGTFWGLLQTVGALVSSVNAIAPGAGTGQLGADNVANLFAAIQEPLQGMGTAFSSSIFGLAGSLVLGFLDLQASQAQNRFYNEVEDWMVSITRVTPTGIESASGNSEYTGAVLEKTIDGIEQLQLLLTRSEEGRLRSNDVLARLADQLVTLNERLGRQEEAIVAIKERALDDTLSRHTQSLDQNVRRLAEDLVGSINQSNQEVRAELRTLTRAITASLEAVSRRDRNG